MTFKGGYSNRAGCSHVLIAFYTRRYKDKPKIGRVEGRIEESVPISSIVTVCVSINI